MKRQLDWRVADIRQIVRPTISDYWEERIQAAVTVKELNGVLAATEPQTTLSRPVLWTKALKPFPHKV